jgi:hypothetical protein
LEHIDVMHSSQSCRNQAALAKPFTRRACFCVEGLARRVTASSVRNAATSAASAADYERGARNRAKRAAHPRYVSSERHNRPLLRAAMIRSRSQSAPPWSPAAGGGVPVRGRRAEAPDPAAPRGTGSLPVGLAAPDESGGPPCFVTGRWRPPAPPPFSPPEKTSATAPAPRLNLASRPPPNTPSPA